jgi:hypothetical protein
MVETFTPAVCGSRRRQRAAVALFTVGAVAAAAVLGALLGLVGGAVGAREAVLAAGVLALLAAAREAGLVRLPLPQARRQVPERWRFELPLPLWATGYGAGLGAGVFTFQPVSTFWVACAGALALARPLPAAVCFSLYGAGRAATILWARRRGGEASEAVERLAGRRRTLLRANAVALATCAALLFLAPAAGAKLKVVAWRSLDPTEASGYVAYARQNGSVVVRPTNPIVYAGASTPSLDGDFLAYKDRAGIRVVRWRTGQQVARIRGPVSKPALDWPLLAFRREGRGKRYLMLRNFRTGKSRRIATVWGNLGRPSLRAGRLAWHVTRRRSSSVYLQTLSTGRRRTISSSRIQNLSNPSLNPWRIVWVAESSGMVRLRLRSISGGRTRTIAQRRSREQSYWTTALGRGVAYWTRWSLGTRRANIVKLRY